MLTSFSQFIGNENTVSAACRMLADGRVPQTLIIEGPEGSGRKTFARLLAAGLMCGNHLAPCGECDVCRNVVGGNHQDVIWVTPDDGKAAVGVDQIRDVRVQAYVRPGQANCKVFVVSGKMNDAAQNAFLKILEEPPAGVYFFLLCQHRSELIETVLSRAVTLTLGAVSYEQALPFLQENGVTDKEDFDRCEGLLGRLLVSGEQDERLARAVAGCCQSVAQNAKTDFLRSVAPIVEDRTLYPRLLGGLYELVRNALVSQSGVAVSDQNALLLARRLTPSRLCELGELLVTQQKRLPYNPNGWLFFTALCAAIFPRR